MEMRFSSVLLLKFDSVASDAASSDAGRERPIKLLFNKTVKFADNNR